MIKLGKEEKIVGYVIETMDYEQFRHMEGNRHVLEARKKKIRKSVKENGRLFNPIITNEKREIIDGGGRFEVFRELGMPIQYIAKEGLGQRDCVVFNSASTGWKQRDYIDSYADMGNENYIRLRQLLTNHPKTNLDSILYAVIGITNNGSTSKRIKEGNITVSETDYRKADTMITYAERFLHNFRSGGKAVYLMNAVLFTYSVPGIDREKLIAKWDKYGALKSISNPVVSIKEALGNLERAYNYRAKEGETIYLQMEYDKYCRERGTTTRRSQKEEQAAVQLMIEA